MLAELRLFTVTHLESDSTKCKQALKVIQFDLFSPNRHFGDTNMVSSIYFAFKADIVLRYTHMYLDHALIN